MLQEHNPDIRHIRGRDNKISDTLSRVKIMTKKLMSGLVLLLLKLVLQFYFVCFHMSIAKEEKENSDPLRAVSIFSRKVMGHTAVSAIQASSVTFRFGNMEPKRVTVIYQLSAG